MKVEEVPAEVPAGAQEPPEVVGFSRSCTTFDGSTSEGDDSILLKVPGQTALNDGQRRKRAGPVNRLLVISSR